MSEHPIGTPAKPNHFVPRNRIQLGLSAGSIIVEAEPKSGTITQAMFCIKQQRPLFVVLPHRENNPLGLVCSGTTMLMEEHDAIPIRTKGDYIRLSSRLEKQKNLLLSVG